MNLRFSIGFALLSLEMVFCPFRPNYYCFGRNFFGCLRAVVVYVLRAASQDLPFMKSIFNARLAWNSERNYFVLLSLLLFGVFGGLFYY